MTTIVEFLKLISFDAPVWVTVLAVLFAAVGLAFVVWAYFNVRSESWIRNCAAGLKAIVFVALALCLLEPNLSCIRPRPGANLFLVVADNSQSLLVRDRGRSESRGDRLKKQLDSESAWQTRLSQDFDVRRYVFDTRLRPVSDFSELSLDGGSSTLSGSLATIAVRYQGRANAGVLLLTDGNATDFRDDAVDWADLPPIYPVVLGKSAPANDISVARVAVSQTNFEAAPVSITGEITCHGYANKQIEVQLLEESGTQVESTTLHQNEDGKPQVVRFQFRPEESGISFYRVRAYAAGEQEQFEQPKKSREATLVNNERLVMVDRGKGPYRVLYVTGRPNWEFKFLRRALEEDEEVNLVGLVRIARREPKFTFQSRDGERTNPLFRGFENKEDEDAEQYDQPVLMRLGTEDENELRDGFPVAADQLFRYHAVILDDLEADFFTQDQMTLLHEFVSRRGGGFLMLGGQESFSGGEYRRTPIGEILPIYVDRAAEKSVDEGYQLALTREGWLQPWVRLRETEKGEEKRLVEMPAFKTLNQSDNIKPGASVLAHVKGIDGKAHPVLVVQRFGKGRSASMLIGDLWRWNLRRKEVEASDLEKSWRQTIRWLVADVPARIEIETRRKHNEPGLPVELAIRVHDESYKPLDNASVRVVVSSPEKKEIEITAEPSDDMAGVYKTDFVPRTPGAYRATIIVTSADGSEVGRRETGWTSELATDEFRALVPNKELLERIAERTGGELVDESDLNAFARGLPNRKVPVTEPWTVPLWHHWGIFFMFTVSCLVGEWGVRRWKGLP